VKITVSRVALNVSGTAGNGTSITGVAIRLSGCVACLAFIESTESIVKGHLAKSVGFRLSYCEGSEEGEDEDVGKHYELIY